MRRPRWKTTLLRLLLVFLALALGDWLLGVVTGVARIRREALLFNSEAADLSIRTKTLIPSLDHEFEEPWRPEGDAYLKRGERRAFRTDEQGFIRGPGTGGVAATYTILFCGDSVTEAQEVDEPFRFPAHVQELLRQRGFAGLRTLNYGVRGHTTQDLLNLLVNLEAIRSVDAMAIMFNVNDRFFLSGRGRYMAVPATAALLSSADWRIRLLGILPDAWRTLVLRSNIAFALSSIAESRDRRRQEMMGAMSEEQPTADHRKLFETNLRMILGCCRALGIRPILLTQPLGYSSEGQAAFNSIIFEAALEGGCDLIDLDQQFPTNRAALFFPDGIHFNNGGSMAAANIIADDLAAMLGSQGRETNAVSGEVQTSTSLRKPGPSVCRDESGECELILQGTFRYPTISADGSQILFQTVSNGVARVMLLDVASGTVLALTDEKANCTHPAFYGNGQVLCVREDGKRTFLQSVAVDTKAAMPVLPEGGPLNQAIPFYSGQDSMICFPGWDREDEHPDLFLWETERRTLRRMTETPWEEWRPIISASRRTVYFISNQRGNFDIAGISLDTGATNAVYASPADEWDPSPSADGRFLVFATKQWGSWDLMLLDMDSGAARRLTDGWGDEYDPSFDPSGETVLFAAHSEDFEGLCRLRIGREGGPK
jgi:lysophospholipase L1-like esterase